MAPNKRRFFRLRTLIILLVGCGLWYGPRLVASFSTEVVHPMRGAAVKAVYATGTVESSVMMPLAPRVAARLIELNFDEGVQVSKGQVLARLEDQDLQNTLKQLQAQENFAKLDFERNQAAFNRNAISISTLQKSKFDWEAAKAAALSAEAKAEFMQLIAPSDGKIVKRDGEVGELIAINQPVFWFTGPEPIRISSEVDEEDIAIVKEGQTVLIRADAFPGKIFHGKVQSITPKGDPISRSYRVRIEFTEAVPLQLGMTAETNIIISEDKNALLVPTTAYSDGHVWIVVDGKLQSRDVSIGAKGPLQTEITSGLVEEDLVVRVFNEELKNNKKVRASLVSQVQE